jgi:Tfp pilus assembly protein PilF
MLQVSRWLILLWATLCLLPVTVMAQVGTLSPMDVEVYRFVQGRVGTAAGDPVPGARVDVVTNAGIESRSVFTDVRGEFRIDYFFERYSLKEFIVTVTVTKKGYARAHAYANYGRNDKPFVIPVVLRPPQNDPTLLSQADLIAGLAPKLRHLAPSDGLSAKGVKDYERGVGEFLDRNRLDLAVPTFEEVIASNPSCLRCRLLLALVDVSWGDWGNAERQLGESVNEIIANRKLSRPEPMVAYGVWMTWQHNPDKAEPYFLEAVRDAPQDPLALQELGRVQCLTLNWEGAEDTLKKALAAGAGPEARLLHAQALLWAGSVKDAEAEMNRYLDGRDVNKMPPRVGAIWGRIQDRKKDDNVLAKIPKPDTPYLDYVHKPPPKLQKLEPPGDQVKLDLILSAAGKNVAELFQKFPNTSSLEKIHQEKLDRKGKSAGSLDQKFRYLCLMPAGKWGPQTDEYRADLTGHEAYLKGLREDYMLTAGFVAAPLIFHPTYQPGSTFRLLGRQKINGRDTYVIAFAQEPGRSRMYGSFKCEGKTREIFFQGVAWVDTTTYRILRLWTDLLTPLPQLKLQMATTEIEFNEVHFSRIPGAFWLPSDVTVTIDWSGRRLRNRHEYSDFVVFNVESTQRIAKPKGAPRDSEEESTPEANP